VGRFAQRQVQGGEGGKSEGARREVNEGSEARARARVALQRGGGPPSGPAQTHELKPFTLGLGPTDISQGSWSSAKGSSRPCGVYSRRGRETCRSVGRAARHQETRSIDCAPAGLRRSTRLMTDRAAGSGIPS